MKTCQSQSSPSFSGRNQSRDAAELRPSEQKNHLHKRFNREIYSGGSTHKKRQLSAIDLKNSVFQHARTDIFEDFNKHEEATNGGVDQTKPG
ncbi:BnaC09g42300D [Brassica napus]|uniref:BnaC09g42300D protein n=2 Tax=Brassica TaxID=3705 RepID=A0A078GP54_BRANA|nr:BnaC09g42300D [Brassica napus]VDD33671.1 unnamed protein product [Brassica oleracea]